MAMRNLRHGISELHYDFVCGNKSKLIGTSYIPIADFQVRGR